MDDYFSREYTGAPFSVFSAAHLAALAVVVGSCLLLGFALRFWRSSAFREGVRWGLAAFALLNVLVWYVWEWHVGLSSWAYSLPLQICTGATILCPFMLWLRSYRLFELCYFWGFAGATQALLTPDIAPYDFPHFVFITFFTSHASILLSVVFMLIAESFRPHWASLRRVIPLTLGLMAVAGVANAITGGNYMYVARKPPSPTLMDYLGPWPWYLLPLIVLGITAMVLVYMPFAIRDWVAHRKAIFTLGSAASDVHSEV